MRKEPKKPTTFCVACDGEGIGGDYVPELEGEGEDRECESCKGTGRFELPCKFEVCPHCEGKGTSSAHLGAYTASEWAEQDDEWKEDYLAGRYDESCPECNGLRVVSVVDRPRCVPAQLEAYDRECQERDEDRRTRAMESGWGYDSGCGF
jgi:RecJ-like exonuclease